MGIVRTTRLMDGGVGRSGNIPVPRPPSGSALTRASSANSIASGLSRMSDAEWNAGQIVGSRCGVRLWITASVLARLGELPSEYIDTVPRKKLDQSLDYLERSQTPGSGWSENGSERADAFTTSWTMIALRSHRRPVPGAAVDFLLRFRQADGGFSAYPGNDPACNPGSPGITATALRALNTCDRAAGDFLASGLRDDLSSKLAGKSSRFYLCSEILDWEAGLAPWPVLHLVSQSAVQFDMEGAYQQALLLRILLRMRNQRAWLAAATLRKMQLADGSWPTLSLVAPPIESGTTPLIESGTTPLSATEKELLTAATAISALAINDAQPGGYFANHESESRKRGAE